MKDDTGIGHKIYECENGHVFDSITEVLLQCGTKLKPCPHCGSKVKEIENENKTAQIRNVATRAEEA